MCTVLHYEQRIWDLQTFDLRGGGSKVTSKNLVKPSMAPFISYLLDFNSHRGGPRHCIEEFLNVSFYTNFWMCRFNEYLNFSFLSSHLLLFFRFRYISYYYHVIQSLERHKWCCIFLWKRTVSKFILYLPDFTSHRNSSVSVMPWPLEEICNFSI